MPDQFTCPDRFRINARARRGVGILLLAAATGCAGRAPQPVAVVQLQDRYADCPAIFAESNNKKIQDLASEQGGKVAQNVAAGVVGVLIWPVWFGMDFQGAAGKEVDALNSRQQYLAVLAEQRNCGAPAAAPPAVPPVAVTQRVAPAAWQPVAQPVTAIPPTASMPAASPPQPLATAAPPSSSPPVAAAPQSTSGAPSATPFLSNPTAIPSSESHDYEQARRQYEEAVQLYQNKLRANAGDKQP